MAILI